jgi:membrane-associated protease RseP (regulator of RpoE activity)
LDSDQPNQSFDPFISSEKKPFRIIDFLPLSGKNKPTGKTLFKHTFLFIITFISVSVVSVFLVGKDMQTTMVWGVLLPYPSQADLLRGALFATLLLSFLTAHEFGHYFAAVYHKIAVSLPYYIPIPLGIGTLGAVIRIREQIQETNKMFDVGAAGPIAGFIVSIIILIIGFLTVPGVEYLNEFGDHAYVIQYYKDFGVYPDGPRLLPGQIAFFFGDTFLYSAIAAFFPEAPPLWEIYHYPFLLAGWFGLFFTALNLMPVGQLDGGHILYTLIGFKRHRIVARLFFILITILASFEAVPIIHGFVSGFENDLMLLSWTIWIGFLFLMFQRAFRRDPIWVPAGLASSVVIAAGYSFIFMNDDGMESSLIWLFWIFFITFFVRVEHPPVIVERELTPTRKVLGWLCMLIFVLSISFNPLSSK